MNESCIFDGVDEAAQIYSYTFNSKLTSKRRSLPHLATVPWGAVSTSPVCFQEALDIIKETRCSRLLSVVPGSF
jgi:hypothetical protein